jgi:hypothetical protein
MVQFKGQSHELRLITRRHPETNSGRGDPETKFAVAGLLALSRQNGAIAHSSASGSCACRAPGLKRKRK